MRERRFEIGLLGFIGIAVVISVIGTGIAAGISTYQSGEKEQMEIQLKIEQEKTKQLQYEQSDTTGL